MISEHTSGEALQEVPRCRAGSSTEHPCWRPASTTIVDGYPCCDEHARVYEIGKEVDGWHCALDHLEDWIKGPVSTDDYGHLERLALNMRDEARREYARAHALAEAAKLVARQGPPEEGEPSLTLEQSEELIRRIIRADSFANARALLEDLPAESIGNYDRWLIVDALANATTTASEEAARYKREIGLKD